MPAQDAETGVGAPAQGDEFAAFVRAGLARLGLDADETMLTIMAAAESIYQPYVQALLEADLSGTEPEPGLDLSKPPAVPERW